MMVGILLFHLIDFNIAVIIPKYTVCRSYPLKLGYLTRAPFSSSFMAVQAVRLADDGFTLSSNAL